MANFFERLFGAAKPRDTGLSVRDWILSETDAKLEVTEVGPFPTPEGRAGIIDPLVFAQPPDYAAVPTSGGQIVVFYDEEELRNSKLALVFPGGTVAGGADIGVCAVDAGMASIFTPATHAAMTAFIESQNDDQFNLYDQYFMDYDDPAGGERKIVPLPDGTPIPYVHSGWGDGGYPVFTLTDVEGGLVALYTDFLGKDESGAWLAPPAVKLH